MKAEKQFPAAQVLLTTPLCLGAYKLKAAPPTHPAAPASLLRGLKKEKHLQLKTIYTSSTCPTFLIFEGRPTDQNPSGSVWKTGFVKQY